MATMSMQGSRPQFQSRFPNYLPTQDYQVPEQDHHRVLKKNYHHQHPRKTFGHPSKKKSWIQLPRRVPDSYPHTGSPTATPVSTSINQGGAHPVTSILGLCSNR
ncbi:Hypothetical predicted protein [Marmota monax]|uniref:Uncharacterized protein n=1 Tax=Marmota monax TaxID=9995 RepID=A0A5E4CKN5_MARMO|nr:Hypothetical predicted protein [Marmota monax]